MTRKYNEDDRFQNRIIQNKKSEMEEYPKGGAAKAEGTTSYRKYIEGCTKAARVSSKKNPLQKKRKERYNPVDNMH